MWRCVGHERPPPSSLPTFRSSATNVKLRDMNVAIPAGDERAIEVASGLPLHHGAQLWLRRARTNKETKHAELVDNNRCHLVVALETGGRWSVEAMEFVNMKAAARAREVLPILARSVHLAWRKRWTRMLAISCARLFANSLVSSLDTWSGTDGATLDVADLCRDG